MQVPSEFIIIKPRGWFDDFFFVFLMKNLNASRPSEHSFPSQGEKCENRFITCPIPHLPLPFLSYIN